MKKNNPLFPQNIHPSWDGLLSSKFCEKIGDISAVLEQEKLVNGYRFLPEPDKVMRFLELDADRIQCVILGMDPYPSFYTDTDRVKKPVATGRSFEVANADSWNQRFKQSSLRNILKTVYFNSTGKMPTLTEIREEIAEKSFPISPPHEWFENLEQQGVLFLNATLTVAPGSPDGHSDLWENAMNDIIRYINKKTCPKWLLFGNKAQERVMSIIGDDENLFCCHHPRLSVFVEEDIFDRVPEIRWVC